MERLTVIIGRRQEGKTSEIFKEYVDHFLGKYEGDDNEVKFLRDALRPVFIMNSFDNKDIKESFLDLVNTLGDYDYSEDDIEEFKAYDHKLYNASELDIIDIILTHINEMDCIVYLDDCDELITVEQAANWISEYSCQDGYNNLDIIMTKQF